MMLGETNIAMGATRSPATRLTLYLRSITATILEKNDLLTVVQSITHSLKERRGESTFHLLAMALLPDVDNTNKRQLNLTETFGKGNKTILARLGIVI